MAPISQTAVLVSSDKDISTLLKAGIVLEETKKRLAVVEAQNIIIIARLQAFLDEFERTFDYECENHSIEFMNEYIDAALYLEKIVGRPRIAPAVKDYCFTRATGL